QVGGARHAVPATRGAGVRWPRAAPGVTIRSRAVRQPGLLRAPRGVRDRPGVDRRWCGRRLPGPGRPAVRLRPALRPPRRRVRRRGRAAGDPGDRRLGSSTLPRSRPGDVSSDAMTRDAAGPFVAGPPIKIAGTPNGPLAGKTFAAKDLFALAGPPTGGGTPARPRH